MAHPFEIVVEQALDATPDQTWEALTTGAAMDAWFMGTNEVQPGEGGTVRTVGPGFTLESTITTWSVCSPRKTSGRVKASERAPISRRCPSRIASIRWPDCRPGLVAMLTPRLPSILCRVSSCAGLTMSSTL